MKITNKEFEVENFEYGQSETGAMIIKSESKKTGLFDLILPNLKLVPQDKTTDIDYLVRANELRKKITGIKIFDEVEFSESEFSLLKSVGDSMKVVIICEGLVDFKKYIRDLKYEKPE